MSLPDLVIFDCDGVLIDSEVLSAEVLISQLADVGVVIDRAYVRTHFLGRSFPTVVRDLRDRFAVDLPADFEHRYRARLLDRFETELRPTPGIVALLSGLHIACCVATSSSPARVARSLEISNLAAFFGDRVFTASQVAKGKPAPDLFLFAAARMNTAPARTLVIEDSLPGLAAARAAGMAVFRYVGGSHLRDLPSDPGGPVPTFDNWDDFPHLLSRLTLDGDPV